MDLNILKDLRIFKTLREYWSKNRVRRYYMLRRIRESRLAKICYDQTSGASFTEQIIPPIFLIMVTFLAAYMFSKNFGDATYNIFSLILGGVLVTAAILMAKGVFWGIFNTEKSSSTERYLTAIAFLSFLYIIVSSSDDISFEGVRILGLSTEDRGLHNALLFFAINIFLLLYVFSLYHDGLQFTTRAKGLHIFLYTYYIIKYVFVATLLAQFVIVNTYRDGLEALFNIGLEISCQEGWLPALLKEIENC